MSGTWNRLARLCLIGFVLGAPGVDAQTAKPFDAAAAFGARVDIGSLRMSPDGMHIVFVRPTEGQGTVVYTVSLLPGGQAKAAFFTDGKPMRVLGCAWVSNDRIVCTTYGLVPNRTLTLKGLLPVVRLYGVNADGTKPQLLSAGQGGMATRYFSSQDASIIDWLPDQDGAVLMTREHLPTTQTGWRIGTDVLGAGVDLVDTRSNSAKEVVRARPDAFVYLSDGRGSVRIVGETNERKGGSDASQLTYMYRMQGSDEWHDLSTYDQVNHTGFRPEAVDHDLNIAYGWEKHDGRMALYSLSLDGQKQKKLIYARPDVDLDGLVRIGRRNRVVGVSYTRDLPATEYFSDPIKDMLAELHKALPDQPLMSVVDSSVDESRLLVYAGSDVDSGCYYLFDRPTRAVRKLLGTRALLEGVTLAHVRPISYPSSDGQMIPAYLTLPPGVESPHGLPAIVMPHGGPSERDRWGFDWLAQFFAARGYAVLQPNFRGSSGYGDVWFKQNGFRSWDVAVGDVVAAGRWLVSQGIADPSKLGIVGWSYGGYAALQSVAIDPSLFKAIVAVAPVTDLAALKDQYGFTESYFIASDFIGDGAHMRDGSPIVHVSQFKQPVLLFHGTADLNVSIEQSKNMASALNAAGAKVDLVTFEDRDHSLEDSAVRADMLRRSDAFLRKAFGMSP